MILRLERISNWLATAAAYFSAIVLVEMVLHILLEIVLRTFFKKSTYVLDEFVTYSVICITFLCMAYALKDNKLIRVELFVSKVSGAWHKALELFGNVVALIIGCYFMYFFWTKIFWRDFSRDRVSSSIAEFPLWIPEMIAMIGFALFMFQLLVISLSIVFKSEKEEARTI